MDISSTNTSPEPITTTTIVEEEESIATKIEIESIDTYIDNQTIHTHR